MSIEALQWIIWSFGLPFWAMTGWWMAKHPLRSALCLAIGLAFLIPSLSSFQPILLEMDLVKYILN